MTEKNSDDPVGQKTGSTYGMAEHRSPEAYGEAAEVLAGLPGVLAADVSRRGDPTHFVLVAV